MIGIAHSSPEPQRLYRLVRGDERPQAVAVHPAVGVGDQFQRDVVHPRQPGRRPAGQPGQFAAVPARQVPAGGPDLLLDQVIVVEEPLGRGRDPPPEFHGLGDELVRLAQDPTRWRRSRGSRRSGPRPARLPGPTSCQPARDLACCSSWLTLNSSAQRLFVRRPNRVLAIGPRGPPNNAFERVHGGP